MSGVLRFAPSPSGLLHLGHALSAGLNAALARRSGARLILRIEDIDPGRSRAAFAAAIIEDLGWLGLAWDATCRQADRLAAHRAALMRLRDIGLVYPCFCSRAAVRQAVAAAAAAGGSPWPRDPDGSPLYPGTCRALPAAVADRRIAAGTPHAWRLDMSAAVAAAGPLSWDECAPDLPDFIPDLSRWRPAPDLSPLLAPDVPGRAVAADPQAWGDVVLGRRDVPSSYHLAVVLDDADEGVTEVVRGRDLYAATAVHRLVQALLHLPAPRYRHHPLVLDEAGAKLSKSAAALSLRALRAAGLSPATLWRALGLEPP
jgi:glutamyl-Q tRNA(Asp) synthetase